MAQYTDFLLEIIILNYSSLINIQLLFVDFGNII